MMKYEELRETELFTFFNFTEAGRHRTADGLVDVRLKPGGFPEFIDALIRIDRSSVVHRAILLLDRDWVGSPSTINPFGKDLAKSFVQAVTHPDDKERAAGIVTTLWRVTGSDDIIVRIRGSDETEPEVSEFLDNLVEVYLGTADEFEKKLSRTVVSIRNIVSLGRKRLQVEVAAIPETES
ncbi:hypothetical protein EU545_05675 [Candidatus Thorarchaeota archaeon]|nr:MAG: hypothetical protein EU545_05675 [Candidatus Thorarchaeota archaeon]